MSIIIYGEPYPEISRHYYLPPPTTGTREALMEQPQAIGTREALMELREAPYPYSKMCNVCNVCNAFVKTAQRYCTVCNALQTLLLATRYFHTFTLSHIFVC